MISVMGDQIAVCSAGETDGSSVIAWRPLACSSRSPRFVAVSQSSTRTASKKLHTIEGTLFVWALPSSRAWASFAATKRSNS